MIETAVTIGVYPGKDYHFKIFVGGEFTLSYNEDLVGESISISFASAKEMESVALAMMRAAKVGRTIDLDLDRDTF